MYSQTNTMLRHLALKATPEALSKKIDALAAKMGDAAFGKLVAHEVVARTRPESALPEIYRHYRLLVRDGIEFFLSQVSRGRLQELVVSQLKLDPDAPAQERLVALAKRFATLHKLGQIIARHPRIDPAVKQWLIQLENGHYGTPAKDILARVNGQLDKACHSDGIDVQGTILSEASVGAVIPFCWQDDPSQDMVRGVFKVLKPGIRQQLDEELDLLQKTVAFFEDNRDRYPLKEFRFLEVFQDVREMLVKEIDLASEQVHLAEAARFYGRMDDIIIPTLLPQSTGAMTAMALLDGPKITDAVLSPEQRRHCAATLFKALVCRPLFSRREPALFHGDPHAGNLVAVMDTTTGAANIGLLDWSLAGRLTRRDRVQTVRLIQGIIKKDLSAIRRAVKALARPDESGRPLQLGRLRTLVLEFMHSRENERLTLIRKTFRLLERLSHEGFVFSADLVLYRKSIFTLEGVIHDLWQDFDMDGAMIQYMLNLMAWELPRRLTSLVFPLADRSENYHSLISNQELHSLVFNQYLNALRSSADTFYGALNEFGTLFGWPALVPVPISIHRKK